MKRNDGCNLCVLCKGCNTGCMWGVGKRSAPLMIINDYPTKGDDFRGEPLSSGDSSALLDHILKHLSLSRDMLYITNAIKCRPVNVKMNPKTLQQYCDVCFPYLNTEIQHVKPKVLLLLGANTLVMMTGLTGITRLEGQAVPPPVGDIPTYVGLSPAYILKNPHKEVRLVQTLHEVAKLAGLKPKAVKQERLFDYEIF